MALEGRRIVMAPGEKNARAPKTVLDKIVHAIRSSPPTGSGGVSRAAITKFLASEFGYDDRKRIALALKRGVSDGKLLQVGQSFSVAGDTPRSAPASSGEPLQIEDVETKKKGGGKKAADAAATTAERGDVVTVKYVGTLDDGTKFDSATDFEFHLGAGDVIKGWDQGIVGMAVGGRRKLVVPPHLGYGKRGCAPDIPSNATLHFEVTMKKIVKADE